MFGDRLLDAIRLDVEERYELEARQAAEHRRLVIEVHPIARPEKHSDEFEIHIISPRTWRCLAVRHDWSHVRDLIVDARPVVRRRLIERASPCALHPQPPTSDET